MRIKGENIGFALTTDCNSRYCFRDPYNGGKLSVIEAASNIIASGAEPEAITDCLNFGNPEIPERFYEFVRCVDGIAETAKVLDTPVISGNVSFYNESDKGSVYPTPVIGMVGLIKDMNKLKEQKINTGDKVYLLDYGEDPFFAESQFEKVLNLKFGNDIPKIDPEKFRDLMKSVNGLQKCGIINYITDISEGGLAIAVLESLFRFDLGFKFDAKFNPKDLLRTLFSELPGRFLVFVSPDNSGLFESNCCAGDIRMEYLGKVINEDNFIYENRIKVKVSEVKEKFYNCIPNLMDITI